MGGVLVLTMAFFCFAFTRENPWSGVGAKGIIGGTCYAIQRSPMRPPLDAGIALRLQPGRQRLEMAPRKGAEEAVILMKHRRETFSYDY
jgi:hypothetical protein